MVGGHFPGIALALLVVAFNLTGDGLRDFYSTNPNTGQMTGLDVADLTVIRPSATDRPAIGPVSFSLEPGSAMGSWARRAPARPSRFEP